MILKEKQLINSQDPKIRAGEDAEKQMAFYLQRFFAKAKDCFVLNDLRIVHDGDAAQIDHLIVTKFGLFIIESKSVHGKIRINKQEEWSRQFNDSTQGMQSPVLQGEVQGKIIRALLIDNKHELLSKMLGLVQKGFKFCPINVYVAISDKGEILREAAIPKLFKADQVSKAIEKQLKELKLLNSLFSLSVDAWSISAEEAENVANFLLSQHRPLQKDAIEIKPEQPKVTAIKPTKAPINNQSQLSFVPKVGAICPKCKQHKLTRKSVSRSDGTETDFLACASYPNECKAIFALIAVAKKVDLPEPKIENKNELKANDNCPQCSIGKLVPRKKKTEFLGCSQYPKCNFTSYRNNA